jgi:hypothetical protein
MTDSAFERLLRIAGPALGEAPASFQPPVALGALGRELAVLLTARNGFYAFESSLIVRPSGKLSETSVLAVEDWNDPTLWSYAYDGMAQPGLFFAADVFGGQFSLTPKGVFSFDPETGDSELLAPTLDAWARELMDDYMVLTGCGLARAWQQQHGPIPRGSRLIPKIPFVLGGAFDVSNLYLCDSVKAMLARANIAVQIRDLPDGATVKLEVVEEDRSSSPNQAV